MLCLVHKNACQTQPEQDMIPPCYVASEKTTNTVVILNGYGCFMLAKTPTWSLLNGHFSFCRWSRTYQAERGSKEDNNILKLVAQAINWEGG